MSTKITRASETAWRYAAVSEVFGGASPTQLIIAARSDEVDDIIRAAMLCKKYGNVMKARMSLEEVRISDQDRENVEAIYLAYARGEKEIKWS